MTQAVTDGLNPLAESALCAWFAGESIQRAVPWVVATGAVIPTPYTKAAALALTALQYGCSFKPDLTPEQVDGSCWEVASPTVVEFYEPVDGQAGGYWACCYGDKAGVQPMNQVLEIIQIVGYVCFIINL